MDCDSIEICLVSNLTLSFIIQSLTNPKDSEKKTGQQPETDVMDQFLDPETDIMGERNYIGYLLPTIHHHLLLVGSISTQWRLGTTIPPRSLVAIVLEWVGLSQRN